MEINSTLFIVLGCRAHDQIRNYKKHLIETHLTMFMTGYAKEVGYKRASINYNTHILLRFNRKTIATKKGIGSPQIIVV